MTTNRRRASNHNARQKHPITGRNLSAVEIERADRLQRKFRSAEKALAAGRSLKEVFKQFSWYWRNRTYHCDSTRKVGFGYSTLVTHYYKWIMGGRKKESLLRRWSGLYPRVPAAVLCNFVEFCCHNQFPHMKFAWAEFARRNGWIGRGRRSNAPVKVSYGQLQYYFSGKKFAKLQSAQRAITRAQDHQANLLLEYTGDIRQRVPVRPRRRTRLELSHGSAEL